MYRVSFNKSETNNYFIGRGITVFKEVYIKTNTAGFATEAHEELFSNVDVAMSRDFAMCTILDERGIPVFSCMYGNIEKLIINND